MASFLSYSALKNGISQGWRNLPLVCLLLPLYPIPQSGIVMRVMQMQLFQFLCIFIFLSCKSVYLTNYLTKFFNPVRFFALFAFLFIVFTQETTAEFVFTFQMVVLAFVLYEKIAQSDIDYSWFRNILNGLLVITFIYCIFQVFKLDRVPFIYKRETSTWTIHGFWTATAYCSTFCAVIFPVILLAPGRWKWILCAIDLWVLVNNHSSIAVLAVVVSILVIVFIKQRRYFIPLLFALLVLGLIFIRMDFGDFSSLDQRFYIWKLTGKEILNKLVFGHGFSAFYQFGYGNIFITGPARGSFFPDAHNELLNLTFEAGLIGLIFVLPIGIKIIIDTFKQRYDDEILGVGLGLISFAIISFCQPVFHAPNTAIFGIVFLGVLENLKNRSCYAY